MTLKISCNIVACNVVSGRPFLCIVLRDLRFSNHFFLRKVLIACLKEQAIFIHDSGLIRNECQNVDKYFFLGHLIIFGTIFF